MTGVFHCFSGSAQMAKELVSKGWYIGFTGVLTFKNARRAVEAAAAIPTDRIVLETDCPYMAKKLAEIKGISPEEAAAQTLRNGQRLYRLAAQG